MNISDFIKKYIHDQQRYFAQLKEQQKLQNIAMDLSMLYKQVHEKSEPIFVLSTGRVGTKLLTEILGADKSVYAVHEPYPELVFHSVKAFDTPNSEMVMEGVDVARYELIRNAFLLKKRYIETNNRITFFAYALAKLYPKARFIHLVRNPVSFVKSGLQRGWYSNQNIYDEGRVKKNDVEMWNRYSNQEKIAWLWVATNQFIEKFKGDYSNRCNTLKSEDLYKGNDKLFESLSFIGVNFQEKEVKHFTSRKVNASKKTLQQPLEKDFNSIKFWQELKAKYQY